MTAAPSLAAQEDIAVSDTAVAQPSDSNDCVPDVKEWTITCQEGGYSESYAGAITGETRTECPTHAKHDAWLSNSCAEAGNGNLQPVIASNSAPPVIPDPPPVIADPPPVVPDPPPVTEIPLEPVPDKVDLKPAPSPHEAPPSKPPVSGAALQDAATALLTTHSGITGDFTFSDYHYQEPDLGVDLNGLKYGARAEATVTFPSYGHWFGSAEARFAYGLVDYSGSGTSKDNSDYLWNFQFTAGRDFVVRDKVDISPYLGVGYRFLYNDARGLSSTGALGYRRESQYVYVPFGSTERFAPFGDDSRISLNAEYDLILMGTQRSYLTDIGFPNDIENHQRHGYGLRGYLLYEWRNWEAGPFFNYWNVDQSDIQCGGLVCGDEPHNQTIEYGLRLGYHFLNFN